MTVSLGKFSSVIHYQYNQFSGGMKMEMGRWVNEFMGKWV